MNHEIFISCLDFHSDGTHSLQTRAEALHSLLVSDVMLYFSKSGLIKQ